MPAGARTGYSAVISLAVMSAARQSRMTLTGIRVPAITAWPCITVGSAEIICICSDVTFPVCRTQGWNTNQYVMWPAERALRAPYRCWRLTCQADGMVPAVCRGAKRGANDYRSQATFSLVATERPGQGYVRPHPASPGDAVKSPPKQ